MCYNIYYIELGYNADIFFVLALFAILSSEDRETCKTCAFLGGFFVLNLVICYYTIVEYNNIDIKPMDVYQGKTTLKYEIIDGVKVDSTVVWKENLNE